MGIPELILKPDEFAGSEKHLGAKTLNLGKMAGAGYSVPDFVAIPSSVCEKLLSHDLLGRVVEQLKTRLVAQKYAVRSSALIEDTAGSSMAGQFHTELDVPPNQLGNAIQKVLLNAQEILKGDLGKFSLLIQEFIEPEFAGILFTRDPQGGHEAILEYHQGRGEDVVSGTIRPQSVHFYRHHAPQISGLSILQSHLEKFFELEKIFGFAQDIEWCSKGQKLYFLQSRPITSITESQYRQSVFLDETLPKTGDFLFEKNEISEIAPSPTPFTWSLLQKIYEPDGPVERVYRRYGIRYCAAPFILQIGNELFSDKEKELHNLLPSFSYFGKGTYHPHFAGLKGIFRTIKNIFAISRISLSGNRLEGHIREALSQNRSLQTDLKPILSDFMRTYELIFEINLQAEKALKLLETSISKEEITIAGVLSSRFPFLEDEAELSIEGLSHMKGNALEIANEEPFIRPLAVKSKNSKIDAWWERLPAWKKTYFQKIILQGVQFSKLREYGRWLTVKKISELRHVILGIAQSRGFHESRNIYFAKIDEIIAGEPDETRCKKRKNLVTKNGTFSFPSRLSGRIVKNRTLLSGVSAGRAAGHLLSADGKSDLKDAILYTKLLLPELTKHFDQIAGIVSEEGGLLSHLSIMARESHIPVIVGFSLKDSGIQMGDEIEIDGSTGTIVRKKSSSH